ncbi:YbjN domain-containing protein [Pseudobacteriovorax antillogorgiicola]|uniref:Putative sensory transduction regulator n=1 Tax=Pseudobacteriovorax antillogorgiicola TaxID=1513793 RepID=A0A1Y6BX59_9BACT|nr:YbjN domain-containing protein [Pseudobacteriovorax antillogorgiicola]TCS50296.1 putative sensory transduction regulator [Pseudobacteriovorax antillogorgiicola]SMF33950.1 Putative sensory transduction regulator [Pseudobacteriovorax antillogorgiicola]
MSLPICSALEDFLVRYGWDYVKKSEQKLITGWQGEHRSYPLLIEISDTWVSFKIQPLLKLNIDWDTWPEIASHMLEMNDATSMAKLSVDSDGQIVLGLDIFSNGLSYESFSDVIGVIGYYAESIYDDLLSILDHVGYRYCESLNILT